MPNSTTDMNDLWTYLSSTDKPVVMYGMGNGADKIIDVLDRYGVTVSDFFASDGFVRGHSFHGKRVFSFSEIKEKYQDFIILLSFGTNRREVLDVIYSLDANFELYAPDVPVAGNELFNYEFFTEHKKELERARSFLADEKSKEIFDCMIDYKLTGRISFLKSAVSSKNEVFKDILEADKCRNYVDVGAYTGDTIRELYSFGAHPDTVTALEPDPKTFKKLAKYAEEDRTVIPINAGAWSEDTELLFNVEGNRNSGVSETGRAVRMVALDNIESAHGADFIKYDVEGSEREALLGTKRIIRESSPALMIAIYHRSVDLYELTELVHELDPEYKLYIRRFEYVPAWDLNLIAVKDSEKKYE